MGATHHSVRSVRVPPLITSLQTLPRIGQINSDGAGKDRNRPKPASTRVGFSPSFPVHGEPQVSHAEASNAGRTRQHLPSVRLRNADNNTQYP